MRCHIAHPQGTDVGDMPAAPEMGVTALRHARWRIWIVIIERGKQANGLDRQLGLAGIAEDKFLIQARTAQPPPHANL